MTRALKAKIYDPSEGLLRAPTKTIAFTGATGLGEFPGTVPVYTTTGRVWLVMAILFCTENFTSAGGGTLSLGTTNQPLDLIGSTGATALLSGEIWRDSTPTTSEWDLTLLNNLGGYEGGILAANVIITIGTATVTDGTLVVDAWYRPITAGGTLG